MSKVVRRGYIPTDVKEFSEEAVIKFQIAYILILVLNNN
jgi:hypothetical protein